MASWSTKRKALTIIAGSTLLAMGIWFYFEMQDPVPPVLRAMYPYFQIEKLEGVDHYTFGSSNGFEHDFFAKEIMIGDRPFFAVAENGPNGTSRYMFLAITLDPEILIEVEKAPRVDNTKQTFEENIFQVDITGDGKKETFVRKVSDDGYLSYVILRNEGETLKEIHMDRNFESWTHLMYVGFEDGAVLLEHDPEGEFEGEEYGKYFVVGDALISESEVQRKQQVEAFMADLKEALTDPKWESVASVFDQNCEILPGSVLQPEGSLFRSMIEQQVEPVKIQPDGSRVYIIDCMLHAYQTSQIMALYDGKTYEPILINNMDDDGSLLEPSYRTVELYYDSARDLFYSHAKGRGMGDCGASTEYKLVGKELIIQKFEADTECDGEYEPEVIYDVNKL
jgi:hypothetical protein